MRAISSNDYAAGLRDMKRHLIESGLVVVNIPKCEEICSVDPCHGCPEFTSELLIGCHLGGCEKKRLYLEALSLIEHYGKKNE